MRLRVNLDKCGDCTTKECIANCPNALKLNSLNCAHCRPEEAPCASACPKNAFIEASEGVLGIDESKCDGCGECAKACPRKAITLRHGKAAKCDLCADNDFIVACTESCEKKAIRVERSEQEIRQADNALGWRVFNYSNGGKTLKEKDGHSIVQDRSGKKWYNIAEFPELSREEALLLKNILEEFQETGETGGIADTMDRFLKRNRIRLEENQKEYFLSILFSLVHGFGPVSLLLEDDDLEEIALTGTGKNYPLKVYHRLFGWCNCNVYFSGKKSVMNTVNRMLLRTDRRLSLSSPRVNGVLPDGSRLNATIPPVSFKQPSFTIRKFNSKKFSARELVKNRTVSAELMAFLSLALKTDCSMLIAGNTGSGKTTTLNSLFSFVPEDERIVIIEETPEMQIRHRHVVKLNVCENRGIGMRDLIVDSLRMRPDRIVVGEIRSGEEVNAFIDTMLAGQGKGSYATFHSTSAAEALKRLQLQGVKEIDLCSLDLLLVQRRWDKVDLKRNSKTELRRVMEACEITEKNGRPALKKLFEYSYKKDRLERKNKSVEVRKKIRQAFSLGEKEFNRELAKRKKSFEAPK